MPGTRFSLELQPEIPDRLKGLSELAGDLFYSWERQVRRLFVRLDDKLWDDCEHNPTVFLRRVSEERLQEAARDNTFMEDYNRAMAAYNLYRTERHPVPGRESLDPGEELIAYFCAEFGLHESLPIYSGGLGILAGDHCKAASDLCLPFVAVGLLYRKGYFHQQIDGAGHQHAQYHPTRFGDLPMTLALDRAGNPIQIHLDLPGRVVAVRVWKVRAGHISLYLLDTDLDKNSEADRSITYQLYGGDITTRIQQEIVLGIGGVRVLKALGLRPTVWHINEGHSAFQILERCRERVAQGMDFRSALELVAAGTVFTTHTPVPAGHDVFDHHLVSTYFAEYIDELGIEMPEFLKLGASMMGEGTFNQTALALRGSRFHNGVSGIHGGVASRMESYIWPQIPPEDNPIKHVTNGVHVPTFLAREWANLLDMRCGGSWRNKLLDEDFWEAIEDIPDHSFWSLRQSLKSDLLEYVRRRYVRQLRRNGYSQAHIERLARNLSPNNTDILVLGFARRFATYKRATLLFRDPERLARLLNDPQRPVLLIFAGKAHPHDEPGQQLIRAINGFAQRPEFEGKIILLEGYDLALSRMLVTGVDIWLNTPEYPLEASGTSGQKAGINGVLNLSVLDGWWGEGYNGENGWAIVPHAPETDPELRDHEESQELLSIMEHQAIPLFFQRDNRGYPQAWVAMSKASMKSQLPRFNAQRMVMDYVKGFYQPASRQRRILERDDGRVAREIARWKEKIVAHWHEAHIRRIDDPPVAVGKGEPLRIKVAATLGALSASDVAVECMIGTATEQSEFELHQRIPLTANGRNDEGETLFEIALDPPLPGLQHYKLRMYPIHDLLSHPFEMGYMLWI